MKSSSTHLQAEYFVYLLVLRRRKITGRFDFCRSPKQHLHAIHSRHLDIKNGEIRRGSLDAVEGGNAVGVGVDPMAFGLERNMRPQHHTPAP